MGFKRFLIIAVAAALLVVAALFTLMMKGFTGPVGSPRENSPEITEETAGDVLPSEEELGSLKEAGIRPELPDEDEDSKVYEEDEGEDSWQQLDMLLSSVNRDLKIIITLKNGSLASGVPFRAEVTKGDRTLECEDTDMDGIISLSDLPGGRYTVHLKPERGYFNPESDGSVIVRSDISYEVVDYIRTLIRTEDEVDVASEDTADIEEEDDGELLNEGGIELENGTIGIDVSKYNKDIDWEKVRASGIEYAIIRMGYRGSSTGALVTDPYYEQNIRGAKAAGLKTGIYFFTQALNEPEAVEEAAMVESLISASDLDLPVFLDVESSGGRGDTLDKDTRTKNIRAFIDTLEHDGYRAGLYANKKWLTSYINADELSDCTVWLAQYKVKHPTYEGRYDAWQYSSKGHVDGITGNVDLNLNLSL